jgi:cell division protease FtsH
MNSQWNGILRILMWVGMVWLAISLFRGMGSKDKLPDTGTPYSTFAEQLYAGQVRQVDLYASTLMSVDINVTTKGDAKYQVYNVNDPGLMGDLLKYKVQIITHKPEQQSIFMQLFISWFPMLLLIALYIFFMRRMQGAGGAGAGGFGKSKARLLEEDNLKVTFADVAGCEEAKEEVVEIADILKDPARVTRLGGKVPRGILMVGPPGTGKTLLARAIAGEAKVPFFTISGSDFVEMFVGVGASRVRDMFVQAKERAPCIVFIDEIDAIGRQRGRNNAGGNDEREQTLNQLLVEMDGFENDTGIIIIAATNRADVLDQALLRPGRFDRQVNVGLPDVKGREQILGVHIKKVPAAPDVQLKYIAQGTPGFSGADLANIVNEAALFAARMNKQTVSMADLEKAKDKILMGAEKHTMVMDPEELKVTAYHEAGHCIVGQTVPEHDATYKVSIMPRGRALGITMFLPDKDAYSASKRKLNSMIASLYGGRVAEELIFGEDKVTTGASNDIERATELARNMVTKWGLSKKLGPFNYSEKEGMMFPSKMSPDTETMIEEEIRAVIDTNYARAEQILTDNINILHAMANALIKYETIDKRQIDDLMNGRPVQDPEGWDESQSRSYIAKKEKEAVLEKGNSAPIKDV